MNLHCFKAYDIRGKVPEELDADLAYLIGLAYSAEIQPRNIIVGYDVRLESPSLTKALTRGLNDGGVEVIDIGLCGTEEVYFSTFNRPADGGIMVTASHNPKGYNGMKLVKGNARPISGDSGLFDIRARIERNQLLKGARKGNYIVDTDKSAYIQHLISYVDLSALKPLKIVANPGNGSAGPVMKLLEKQLPFKIHYLNDTPNGNFPHGVPNPLLPENRAETARTVIEQQADLGIAWDGDFDRCFLFDNQGRFIEGYYLVGLLAEVLLAKNPGAKIIHDPRLTWNTIEQVRAAGGLPIQSKTGHAFIKERMRAEDAAYGGEMSAHHYFRNFSYCDSGMIPWLLITELMSRSNTSLAELVAARVAAYPCSGEINYRVADPIQTLDLIKAHYQSSALLVDYTDGLSMEFSNWRFNLRSSNTEPLLRLNVETRGNPAAIALHVAELEIFIK